MLVLPAVRRSGGSLVPTELGDGADVFLDSAPPMQTSNF